MSTRICDVGTCRGVAMLAMAVGIMVLATAALQAQTDNFGWVPVEAQGADVGGSLIGKRVPIVITEIPKATASIDKFTKLYLIDLTKFNISNEGKNAVETSKGINAALQDAKAAGANRIVFPRGTYLISETDPIMLDLKDTVIDLNGATLQINTNGLKKYATVKITFGAENLRLTNGTLRGDKDTHDYAAGGEWGHGLVVESGRNLEVDHMTFTNFMGDGVVSETGTIGEGAKERYYYVKTENLEQGAFSDAGQKVVSAEKTRTITPYDISVAKGKFEFGFTAEYMGFPYVKGRVFQACFYKEDMTFIGKVECLQYKKTAVPEDAKWIHLEFNQPEVKGAPKSIYSGQENYCGFISNFRSPVDVHLHDNHSIGNRRLGMAVCGGQRWIIENNLFEENGGTAPAYGVDFEDGWLMMQDIVFRNNKFKNNRAGDLVVCGGSELQFEGNVFEKSAHFWDATLSYTFRNNTVLGGGVSFKTRTGHVTAEDNQYENCNLLIRYDPRGINDGVFHKPGVSVQTPAVLLEKETLVNVKRVTGTYFNFVDSTLKNVSFAAGDETRLVKFKNCEFDNVSVDYSVKGPEVQVTIDDCKGTLDQKGAGLNRRRMVP